MLDVTNTEIPISEQDLPWMEGLPDERQIRQRLLAKMRSGHPPERNYVVGLVKWALHYRTPNEEIRSATSMFQRMAEEQRIQDRRLRALGMTEEEYHQETNELLERLSSFVGETEG